MKLIAKFTVFLIAPLLLSSCKSIGGVTFSACYDKICGSVGISTNGATAPPPTTAPPTPQSFQVKEAGK